METRVRTKADYEQLRREGRRLVLEGVSFAEVGRRLQVGVSTVHRWAVMDGFRLKDREAEKLTGERAPLPAWVERAKYRRAGDMLYPEEYAGRIALAAEAQAEAARAHVALLSEPGGPLAPELDPEKAAQRAMADADRLRAQGQYVSAERSARIAERLLRADVRLQARLRIDRAGDEPAGRAEGGAAGAAPAAPAAEVRRETGGPPGEKPWPGDLASADEAVARAARQKAFKLHEMLIEQLTVMRIENARARREGREPEIGKALNEMRSVHVEEAERDAIRRHAVEAGLAAAESLKNEGVRGEGLQCGGLQDRPVEGGMRAEDLHGGAEADASPAGGEGADCVRAQPA